MTDAPRPRGLFERAAEILLAPKDAAALAVFRFLFGAIGFVSALRFLAYGWVDELFVTPRFFFHYWGASWVKPLGGAGMHALFYGLLAVSACVALGLFYRVAIVLFCAAFAYLQLVDVTNYLNHYYLVALLALLMAFMPLNAKWSLDARLFPRLAQDTLPAWCTYLLRFQVAVVYTFAGLAKVNTDWLVHAQPLNIWLSARTGMPLLGPVFAQPWAPHVMSWAGCLFDLTIAWFLMARRTRVPAFAAVIVFHVLTRAMFPIGMFPFIMVTAAMVFFSPSWPRRFWAKREAPELPARAIAGAAPRWFPAALAVAAAFVLVQITLPFRTHLYGGDVSWHEQGMRFSWRVMLREKNGSVTYLVENPVTGRRFEVPARVYLTDRQERDFATQPDLILQLAHRIADDYSAREGTRVKVRAEVMVSLNGRPAAPLVDPEVDLASVSDSLGKAAWILPSPSAPPPRLRPSGRRMAWNQAWR